MVINNIKEMFRNHKHVDIEHSSYLTINETFPEHVYKNEAKDERIICTVSLYCKICIDLLPSLKDFGEEFILITDGTETDNKEILHALEYSFPVISCDYDTLHDLIENTPCLFAIDEKGLILAMKEIDTFEEVYRFIDERR
ncbi:hypothetical protein [Bacillus sp. SM2101]|uniref:hypothetical protein n=1 Tax=Bacillus sp. SM2101 TaxID=2805366 RepID=UPI001BDE1089|nr:hypothetical protein [Bacillus sp. SM2101]